MGEKSYECIVFVYISALIKYLRLWMKLLI